MAAGIPVLVPDQGGAASIVRDNENGFTFRSNCMDDLAMKLKQIALADRESIRSIVAPTHRDEERRERDGEVLSQSSHQGSVCGRIGTVW